MICSPALDKGLKETVTFFSTSSCMLTTNLIRFPSIVLQDSTNSFRQTEEAAAGEAGVRSGGGQVKKGTACVCVSV